MQTWPLTFFLFLSQLQHSALISVFVHIDWMRWYMITYPTCRIVFVCRVNFSTVITEMSGISLVLPLRRLPEALLTWASSQCRGGGGGVYFINESVDHIKEGASATIILIFWNLIIIKLNIAIYRSGLNLFCCLQLNLAGILGNITHPHKVSYLTCREW